MASSSILSDNGVGSGSAGIKSQGGNDGSLLLQTTTAAGAVTTALTISNTQVVTYANQPIYTGGQINGVAYLGASKNLITDPTKLAFDGTNLGIGATPASPLHIASAIAPTSGSILRIDNTATTNYSATSYVGGQIRLNYTNATSRYGGINFSNTGATSQEFFGVVQNSSGYGDFVWQGYGGGGYLERMRLDASGNLGVGTTTTANSRLTVVGDTGAGAAGGLVVRGKTVDYQGISLFYAENGANSSAARAWQIAPNFSANGNLEFRVSASSTTNPSSTAMTLDASGNLTVPAKIFTSQVNGDGTNDFALLSNNASKGIVFYTGVGGVSAVERARIASSGIVTMSAYGAGAATFSASGVISSVSDETWKIKDGVPVDPDLMIKKLEPGYWYYNDEKKEIFGTERQLGFYAQNVNVAIGPEAAPEPEVIITKAEDGSDISTTKPWGYYDRSVLAVVVLSLQKALATIETLETRLAALEAK